MSNKRIAIVGTVGVPACYGGFETLAENLIEEPRLDYTVYCSSRSYTTKPDHYKGARLIYIPLRANGMQSVLYDIFALVHTLFVRHDTVLILGVSGCLFLPLYRLLSKSKIVTNIDGLEWQRNKWSAWAKRFLKLSERLAVKYSDVVIADSRVIADYVLREYAVVSEVIAYGGDHALLHEPGETDDGYALAICRIEPENNIEMILSAFSHSDNKIKFIGNWEHRAYARTLRERYAAFENIEMINPVYDADELFKLRSHCAYYIHGHSAGGTNPSLVEMMHFSRPLLCFDCTHNRSTTEDQASYFCSSEQLIEQIEEPLPFNGEAMKSIAGKRYAWEKIREDYFTKLS